MRWPLFVATLIRQRSTYWMKFLDERNILTQPRRLAAPQFSRQIYTDATPTSVAALAIGPPRQVIVQHYTDALPIAFTEMAAAIKGIIWYVKNHLKQPELLICLRIHP
jgi:hypothetical protein